MTLGQAVGELVKLGASYPSNTEAHKACALGAAALNNIEVCYGYDDDEAPEALISIRKAMREIAKSL